MAFDLKDYVDVHERIARFYEKYPQGSVQTEIAHHDDKLVVMRAIVYRDPEDPRPSIAHSQLGIPGKTNYTRDSEIENAETSAVGRAIAFLGFEIKNGIASDQEVRNKRTDEKPAPRGRAPQEAPGEAQDAPSDEPSWMRQAQLIAAGEGLKFKDIPDLKFPVGATRAEGQKALTAWRISISGGEKRGDVWVLEQFKQAVERAKAVAA